MLGYKRMEYTNKTKRQAMAYLKKKYSCKLRNLKSEIRWAREKYNWTVGNSMILGIIESMLELACGQLGCFDVFEVETDLKLFPADFEKKRKQK